MALTKEELSESKEDFFKMLPLIPLILTIAGACRLYFHYNKYNIKIFEYIEIQEILTLFLNDTYGVFFNSFAAGVLIHLQFDEQNILYIKNISNSNNTFIRIIKGVFSNRNGLVIGVLILSLFNENNSDIVKLIVFFFVTTQMVLILTNQGIRVALLMIKNLNTALTNLYGFYLWFFVSVFIYTFVIIAMDRLSIPEKKTGFGSSFKLNNEVTMVRQFQGYEKGALVLGL